MLFLVIIYLLFAVFPIRDRARGGLRGLLAPFPFLVPLKNKWTSWKYIFVSGLISSQFYTVTFNFLYRPTGTGYSSSVLKSPCLHLAWLVDIRTRSWENSKIFNLLRRFQVTWIDGSWNFRSCRASNSAHTVTDCFPLLKSLDFWWLSFLSCPGIEKATVVMYLKVHYDRYFFKLLYTCKRFV